MAIKNNYVVKKRNILNEIRSNNMTLQELRFFSIYLSKINPNDIKTRLVKFSIEDFQSIMELGRINIDYMKQVTNSLLSKVVNIPAERGGYIGFQLFKECTVDMDEYGLWYVEIDAHDKALPLMFEFKEKYFCYKLWNALRLKSSNQLRMYEILKQYEKIGVRILSLEELKILIGIDKKEYERFDNFKQRVLESCQEALEQYTDIKFTYEPYGKKGRGGKILFLKFNIYKNNNHIDQLTLEQFIQENKMNEEPDEIEDTSSVYDERIHFFAEACNDEFSFNEMTVLYNLMVEYLPYSIIRDDIKCYRYVKRKYDELNMRSDKTKIFKRFNYLKSIIVADEKHIGL